MNPVTPAPSPFNLDHLSLVEILSSIIPPRIIDTTPDSIFSSPFTENEVAEVKDRLHKRMGESSASGIDGMGYSEILQIDKLLTDLFNRCLEVCSVPQGRETEG
jgi:hypothetical protein